MVFHHPQLARPRRFQKAGNLLGALLLVAGAASTTVVDLSQPWTTGLLYNANKAYCTIQASMNRCFTRGYVVIQNGQVLAEGYTDGNEASGIYDAFSVTKSWSTFILGLLVDQGKLNVTETLNDIFPTDADWDGVCQADEKRTIRVEELLTMSSGLARGLFRLRQDTLQRVLNQVNYLDCTRGQFNYLADNHIISRIIERRAGQTPREFATASGVFTKLGINDTEFEWATFGGVEGSAFGLQTNPRVLAKLGQLYLQGGLAAPGDQLVSEAWVNASTQSYLENDIPVTGDFNGYGYQWYIGGGILEGGSGALGASGQVILFLPNRNTTIAIMGTNFGPIGTRNNREFLYTIVENLGDLSISQTTCPDTCPLWRDYLKFGEQLILQQASTFLLGNNGDI